MSTKDGAMSIWTGLAGAEFERAMRLKYMNIYDVDEVGEIDNKKRD